MGRGAGFGGDSVEEGSFVASRSAAWGAGARRRRSSKANPMRAAKKLRSKRSFHFSHSGLPIARSASAPKALPNRKAQRLNSRSGWLRGSAAFTGTKVEHRSGVVKAKVG